MPKKCITAVERRAYPRRGDVVELSSVNCEGRVSKRRRTVTRVEPRDYGFHLWWIESNGETRGALIRIDRFRRRYDTKCRVLEPEARTHFR